MRKIILNIVLLIGVTVLACDHATAQFTIKPETDEAAMTPGPLLQEIPGATLGKDYFDRAAWNDQMKKIRRERNTIDFESSLTTSLNQVEKWGAGGSNTFSAGAKIFFRHQYKKEKLSVDYRINADYGLTYIDSVFFKNIDELKVNASVGWTMHRNWSYSATLNFKTQFSDGYKSATENDKLISRFMSPGTIEIAGGFTYAREGSPLKVTLSPIAGKLITVLDEQLSGSHNVPQGERFAGAMGPYAEIFFDKAFGRSKRFSYRTKFNIFSPYKELTNPSFDWDNTIGIKISRFITSNVTWQMSYARQNDGKTPDLRYKYAITIGLAYKFRNK